MKSLYDQLVAASRLPSLVAPFTLARLLLRARIFEPEKMTAEDLKRALPHLEEGLKTFLTKGELASAMEAFRKLADG